MDRLPYYSNCVSWPSDDVDAEGGLSDLIDGSIGTTRETFLKHVNRDDIQDMLTRMGYASHPRDGVTLKRDWAVSYGRGKLHGRTAYFMTHSLIEYVFWNQRG